MGLLNQLLQLLGSLSENLIALLGGKQTQLMGNCSKNSTTLNFWACIFGTASVQQLLKLNYPTKAYISISSIFVLIFRKLQPIVCKKKNAGYFLRQVFCWNFQLFSSCFEFLAASCSSVVLKIQPPIVLENEKNLKLTLVFQVSVSKLQVSS